MSETPMLKQYNEIKAKHQADLLFFRLGDFYEMFGPDAIKASKILNITLTARHKGTPNEMPMCGVPFHAADNYIAKLTKSGERVAICDQISDSSEPGIVKREVVRIVTPGTTLDENILNHKNNHYLVSLLLEKDIWGLALCDLTTGEFQATELADFELLKNEINRLDPSEVIVTSGLFNDTRFHSFLKDLANLNVFQLPAYESAEKNLIDHFKVPNLAGFGLDQFKIAVKSAGNLLGYLKETQKTNLEHVLKMSRYAFENYMVLDQATIRNLELLQNNWTFEQSGSLLGIIDQTITAMGARMLRKWLILPLINVKQINQRLEAVAEIKDNPSLATRLLENFKQLADLERLLGRIGCNQGSARDLVALKNSLILVPHIKAYLSQCQADLLYSFHQELADHNEVVNLVDSVLVDDPPLAINEGGMIRDNFNSELDELRKISTSGKTWLADFQAQQIERTKINSLKIKFNKVFGYYIEISKANLELVPENYIRKQTLVNAERFITPELKEYEDKILNAEAKINDLEYRLFLELREQVIKYFAEIQTTARILARLDVLFGFAILAKKNNYYRPQVNDGGQLKFIAGRHPVIENNQDNYVPNDLQMDHQTQEFLLLTGPNMSGKSSYLRQVAIITLMAQIGSFVPAQQAEIGVVDRIFTRVGASDNLSQGVSTFMNEMQEAANILNNATDKSLIVLDELGRGTSTYDGLSIAWAIIEYIHNNLQAKTLFATHYHELVNIIEKLDRAQNYCVAVSEDRGKIVFLHQIIKGAGSQSYGIEVAKLAGLPPNLIVRSQILLESLEAKKDIKLDHQPQQISLRLNTSEDKLKKEIQSLNPDEMTPLQALQKLIDLKKKLN